MATRRDVLRYGGVGIGVGAAATLGWQFRPTTPPDGPAAQPLAAGSGPSLLVVHASMMGSTASQARWMADAAAAQGYRVELAPAQTAPDPAGYDAVILGSAIRAANWLDPILDWAGKHGEAIAARPHGLFQCSMTCAGMIEGNGGAALTEGQREELHRDSDSLRAAAPALSETEVTCFPGRLEFARLTPLLRLGYPFVAGSLMTGDYRRRDAAEAWAAKFSGAAA